ncbi:MAG: hypothetical protein ACOVQX_01510 [Legionella sp.]
MGLHKDIDDGQAFSEFNFEDELDSEQLNHKKRIRQMVERKLERKRLKEDLDDELDDEFDWSQLDRE